MAKSDQKQPRYSAVYRLLQETIRYNKGAKELLDKWVHCKTWAALCDEQLAFPFPRLDGTTSAAGIDGFEIFMRLGVTFLKHMPEERPAP